MKKSILLVALVLVGLVGCASQQCNEVQPYQRTVAKEPLQVPTDLSEPPLRSQSPDVEADAANRREDGRCLELPPPFDPETNS